MIQVFVILENVQKKQTEQVVVEELRNLGYTVQAFYANSASFGLPQSRPRLYVLGVDARSERCKLIHGPEQWQAWLQASCQGNMLQLQSAAGSCIIFNI
jgi:site-specific DNA-cytosine methylase